MIKKQYSITKKKRVNHVPGFTWYTWILTELILENGLPLAVRTVADFGHTKDKRHYQDAKKLKNILVREAENE